LDVTVGALDVTVGALVEMVGALDVTVGAVVGEEVGAPVWWVGAFVEVVGEKVLPESHSNCCSSNIVFTAEAIPARI